MPADTYGSILGLILLGTGNDNNTWGTTFNASAVTPAERAIAGTHIIGATSGTVDLSGSPPPASLRQDVDLIQIANGALTADLTVIVPNLSKTWWFWNNTTGNFNMFVQVPGGVAPTGVNAPGGLVQIPQGLSVMVMCDGSGHLIRHDDNEIGSFLISGKAAVGAGEFACNGASLLRAEFPNLFAKIGTTWGSVDSTHFTLPNFTDTARFLRSSSGSLTVGTYQSNQLGSHAHTFSGTTATENAAHSHLVSGTSGTMNSNQSITPTFNKGVGTWGNYQQITSGQAVIGPYFNNGNDGTFYINPIGIDHTHPINIQSGTESAYHAHTFSGTTASTGGSETRPEAAVVLMGIRY